METRRWRRRAGALAAGVLLGGQVILGTSGASAAPVPGAADRAAAVTVRDSQPHQQRQLPDAGFDGILVAAIGTGLTGGGWLLMLAGSRRLRRRSR
ncbi:MAG TPA: hypothetical protein VEV45_06550 [Streptosporangiaceae bacterium]|nr:hypothetical protein [Streptosporangiaceae bacterium]